MKDLIHWVVYALIFYLDFAPLREGLSHTERTEQNITKTGLICCINGLVNNARGAPVESSKAGPPHTAFHGVNMVYGTWYMLKRMVTLDGSVKYKGLRPRALGRSSGVGNQFANAKSLSLFIVCHLV